MTTYASFLVSNLTLTPSLYYSTITLRVPLSATSALISTIPGTSFIDGTTSKTTTGYITVCLNSNDSNFWNIQDTFPYADYADLERFTASSLSVRSTMYMGGHMDVAGNISSFSTLFTEGAYSQKGKIIPTRYLLESTVRGLGSIGYISSGPYAIKSTMDGLGSVTSPVSYISVASVVSTVNGLGTLYVSYASLSSTISGNTTFIRTSNLVSTVDGLGPIYLSSPALQSTIGGISTIYTPFTSNISTVSSLISMEGLSLASTVSTLGTIYISSPGLQSTVNGLGNFYVSSAQVNDFVSSAEYTIARDLLSTMYVMLGSGSNGYISTPQLFSTVASIKKITASILRSNVQTLGYISTLDLFSTIPGLSPLFVSAPSLISTVAMIQLEGGDVLISTVKGLGTAGYISAPTLISTVHSLSNVYSSNLISFYVNMGAYYMSTGQIVSTVRGLGSPTYISIPSLTSTTAGYINYVLLNTVKDAGSNYVSRSGFVSTTTGILSTFSNELISTVNGLGSIYMSTGHFVSTVAGLGTPTYISVASLMSSVNQYENLELRKMVTTPGTSYVSTLGIVSTTSGLIASFSNQFISTVGNLGLVISQQLTSTVNGLGTLGYISIASLVSSSTYYINYGSIELQKFVTTAGSNVYTGYISTSGLNEFNRGSSNEFEGLLLSTLRGISILEASKNFQGVVTSQLFSTVNGLASPTYISGPHLVSTALGYSNIGKRQLLEMINNIGQTYISRGGLESTSIGLTSHYNISLTSTINGLATSSYISIADLFSTVASVELPAIPLPSFLIFLDDLVRDNQSQLTGQIGNNSNMIIATYFPATGFPSTNLAYLSNFSRGLTSTAVGLGTSGYLSSPHVVSTVNNLGSLSYFSTASLVSTTLGLQANQRAQLQKFVTTPDVYISTATLVSTTIDMLNKFKVQLTSTTVGMGNIYISTSHVTSTVQGLGLLNVSTTSLASTIASLTANYALSTILLFENNLGSNYISTAGIISTVTGLSNIYATSSNLYSTVAGLGRLYVSSGSVTSTITGLSNQQTNQLGLLTSTVRGLGQIYFSTLTQPVADSPALCNTVAYFAGGYINTLAAYSNGYLFLGDTSPSGRTLRSVKFYELPNLSYSENPILATNYISADIVRTIAYGTGPYSAGQSFPNPLNLTIRSDSNLKQHIVPLSPSHSLEQVTSMRGVYYKMIDDPTPYIGCIAQEVEEVFPEVITTHVGESNWKAMKYEFLLAPLVESVKELSHIHSTLKYFVQKNQGNIQ